VTWFDSGSQSLVWGAAEDGAVTCVARGSVLRRPRGAARERQRHNSGEAPQAAFAPDRPLFAPEHAPEAGGRERRASTSAAPPRTRVAMVGTFDVANFGDLLLPMIAGNELGARLGAEYAPTLYSYRSMSGGAWPFEHAGTGAHPDPHRVPVASSSSPAGTAA
jgi:hypothetical protein